MDAGPSAHPTPETLQAYALAKLDDASAEVVSAHLDDCPDCRQQLTELAPDTFLRRLRGARQGIEPSAFGSAMPGGPPIGETVNDDAIVDPSSSPRMSSTGLVDATSDALNGSDEASLQRGTRVGYFGDYELLKVLGEGGMGIVYKARQISLNRPVALKMIKASRFPSSDEVRRFQNEAEAVARLDHPNIVPIFEVGRFEDQHYFSMKLIAGESLDKGLKDYVADPRRAARLMVATSDAILHAHQRGILHRDLKPANILVDSTGQPHVSDFGLAKRIDGDSELTCSGAIVGTPAYMAPEQASGKRGAVTTSTDVYGLGAILFALLTGRAPFGGPTVLDVLEQVRGRIPDSPRKLNPRVPPDLDVVCLKCLEKDPRRRYASADGFAQDIKRWLAGEPIAARPVGSAARLWMWCRRNPVVAWAATLVSAALVGVAVLAVLYASVLEKSLANSNLRLAALHFQRGQVAFEKGRTGEGLIWMIETWRSAVAAGDPGWQHTARANLAAWQSHNVEIKAVFSPISDGGVRAVAFRPDGKAVLTGGDGTRARLWVLRERQRGDNASSAPFGPTLAHEGAVLAVAFSRNSKTAITGSDDNTARLWDAATARPIGQPLAHWGAVATCGIQPERQGRTHWQR